MAEIAGLISGHLAATADPDPMVGRMVAWLARHPRGAIDGIVRLSGLSERQILRRFDQAVGYGPKTLQRILRLQRLLWLAGSQTRHASNLARLAFAAGYADQPHMTREVVALTGATPHRLLASRRGSAVSEMFKTAAAADGTLRHTG
jgi:transcriptional regulator GlxA family with amidase domain